MLYVPASHLEHDEAPPALYVPAAQLKQAALDVLPVLGLYVPAAQLKHAEIDVLPEPGLYVPALQFEHEDAPPVL